MSTEKGLFIIGLFISAICVAIGVGMNTTIGNGWATGGVLGAIVCIIMAANLE